MDTEANLLTLPEAAKLLRLKESTLRAWRLAHKHLNFRKIGGRVLVLRADLEKFVARSLVEPEPFAKQ
jgi:excisionase family DNA binding protein